MSARDLLLQASLPTVLDGMSLSCDLEDALLGHTGVLGVVLADVLAWEVAADSSQLRSGTDPVEVGRCYLQALAWATDVCGVLDLTP